MIVKKTATGEWTAHRQVAPSGKRKIYRDWFLIKSTDGKGSKLSLKPETYQRYMGEFFSTINTEASKAISYQRPQEQFRLRPPLERN